MPGQWTLEGSLEKLDAHIKSRGASCIAGTHFLSRRAGGLARLSAAAPLLCGLPEVAAVPPRGADDSGRGAQVSAALSPSSTRASLRVCSLLAPLRAAPAQALSGG